MAQISVIVPVYKVEQYLRRCVGSILAQTFSDLEIILVNDGSPDNCGAICDEYAQKDSRVKVIHKENGGLSSARNAGLDIASGKYIGFVDSDDYIHPQMYELLHYYAIKDGSDIVSQQKVPTVQKERFDPDVDGEGRLVVSSQEVLEQFHEKYHNLLWMTVMIKLYRREMFDALRFREGIIHEDSDLFPETVRQAKKITIVPFALYYYTINPASIMRSNYSPKRYVTADIFKKYMMFFHEQGIARQRDYYGIHYLYEIIQHYEKTREQYPQYMPELKPYLRAFREFRPFIRKHCSLSRLQRVLLEIFPALPRAAIKLHKFLDK